MANIDWVVAVALFIFFVTWSFGYYANIYTSHAEPLRGVTDRINDRVIDYLTVNVEYVPIKYHSGAPSFRLVLYFEYDWPFGRDTTQIYSNSGAEVLCSVKDNIVYLETPLEAGDNYFTMVYRDEDVDAQECDSGFLIENETLAKPMSAIRRKLVSQGRLNEMMNMTYEEFTRSITIDRNVRVEIEKVGETIVFGPPRPRTSDVFVRETLSKIIGSGDNIKIRVLVW